MTAEPDAPQSAASANGPASAATGHAVPPDRVSIEAAGAGRKLDALPILYLLGFVILAASLIYVWRHPGGGGGAGVQEVRRTDTLRQDVATLGAKVGALETRPVAAAPDLGPLDARLKALEGRPAAVATDLGPVQGRVEALEGRPLPAPVDLAPLQRRLDGLEARKPADLGPLEARIAALEGRKPVDLAPLEGRVNELGQRLDGLAGSLGGKVTALESRLEAVDTAAKANAAALDGVAQRAQRARRVAAAAMALEGGQRLGDIPGAPASVARFAQDAPPTDAALRLSFDAAADAAHRNSQPAVTDGQNFAERMWSRAQQSVTVRQGERVLVGDPVAGVLAQARQALDAGDLGGAVRVLNAGLAGPAKAAMAPWVGRAQSLLDARAGLAEMAAG